MTYKTTGFAEATVLNTIIRKYVPTGSVKLTWKLQVLDQAVERGRTHFLRVKSMLLRLQMHF